VCIHLLVCFVVGYIVTFQTTFTVLFETSKTYFRQNIVRLKLHCNLFDLKQLKMYIQYKPSMTINTERLCEWFTKKNKKLINNKFCTKVPSLFYTRRKGGTSKMENGGTSNLHLSRFGLVLTNLIRFKQLG